jgi:hypothetical protein
VDARDARRLRDIILDCRSPAALARFWARALNWPEPHWDASDLVQLAAIGVSDPENDPFVFIDSGDPRLPRLGFQRVPEPKAGKNRVHLDVNVAGAEAVDALLSAGASVLHRPPDEHGEHRWIVMGDPEGNEFCATFSHDGRKSG